MLAEDVVDLQRALGSGELDGCVVGGCGVDALPARQSRVTDVDGATPLWATDHALRPERLAAPGRIADVEVRCITATTELACHTGYALPPEHAADLELLRALVGEDGS